MARLRCMLLAARHISANGLRFGTADSVSSNSKIAAALFTCPSASAVTSLTSPSNAAATFRSMQRLSGGTSIVAGLKQAASLIPRYDVTIPRILVLVSDGNPECLDTGERTADVIATAKSIRDSGVFILPVGVGSGVAKGLLQQVASDPRQVYSVTNYAALVAQLKRISGGACAAVKKPCTSLKSFGYSGNMAGDVLVLDVGSMSAGVRRLSKASDCQQACIHTQSCNGWVFCNSPDGCGYTCSDWVAMHPKMDSPGGGRTSIDVSRAAVAHPISGFGPWSYYTGGCRYKAWPFGMCTLKRVQRPANPTFYTNEMKGWLSGTLVSNC
eukprot:GHUV01011912.1.p1 GENE.GHUV01011912.1~~GHUV01011912.1.p1  ORF type:complete len:327 (+),score=44.14 GHUV01011912.1:759-1739(+)